LYSCSCGMLYTRNPWTIAGKRAHYQELATSSGWISYHNLMTQLRSTLLYSHVLRELSQHLPRQEELHFVDFGCAGGLFLLATQVVNYPGVIQSRGIAFEPGEKSATESYTGYPVVMMEEAGEKLRRWADVVTMLNVLEHVNHPDDCLDTVREVLRPQGLLIVDVPNNQVMRWKARILRRWPPLALEEHINHFTPRTLDGLLRAHGFQRVRRLSGLVQGASGFGFSPTFKQYLRWTLASLLFHLSAQRVQLFIHYAAIYRKLGNKARQHAT